MFESATDLFYIHRAMQNIGNLTSSLLFNQLLTCVVFLALNLFSLDLSVKLNMSLILNMNCLIQYVVICFIYCYFSEKVTQISLEIGVTIYDSTWYALPIKLQKLTILMISNSQREFRFKGFGMIDCSLAMFLSVKFYCFPFDL